MIRAESDKAASKRQRELGRAAAIEDARQLADFVKRAHERGPPSWTRRGGPMRLSMLSAGMSSKRRSVCCHAYGGSVRKSNRARCAPCATSLDQTEGGVSTDL